MTQCKNHYCKPFPFYFIFKIIRSIAHELFSIFISYTIGLTPLRIVWQKNFNKISFSLTLFVAEMAQYNTITCKKNNDTIMDFRRKMYPILYIYKLRHHNLLSLCRIVDILRSVWSRVSYIVCVCVLRCGKELAQTAGKTKREMISSVILFFSS